MRELLIRTATGVVFVIVVLAMMLVGRSTYSLLLGWVAGYSSMELWRLVKTPRQKWLGSLYIIGCMVAMGFFPMLGTDMTGGEGFGMDGLLDTYPEGWDARIAPAFIIIVWANDTFAYLSGITLGRGGRHKLCPQLSPKKTWEGFAGGIVGAVAVAVVIGRFWMGANIWLWAAFGLVVALAAVGGDLAESHLKRQAGVKDAGRMFPGHGGMLDRFDATLGAVPAAFLFFLITYLVK